MADVAKYQPINGPDLRTLFSLLKTRRTIAFAYCCMFALLLFTIFLAFNQSPQGLSLFNTNSDSYRSQFSSLIVYFFPNTSSQSNLTIPISPIAEISGKVPVFNTKIMAPFTPEAPKETEDVKLSNPTNTSVRVDEFVASVEKEKPKPSKPTNSSVRVDQFVASVMNSSVSGPVKKQSNGSVEGLMGCKLFDGDWVKDDSYPLYKPGSCSIIDPQFSCISNGRPDKEYLKYKWKPHGCTLPRLDANRMLNMLRGKRLVFVGDSLNRNMWESMVCILRNAAKDQSKVFEAHGRHHFRGEAEYSFVFKEYNFTVEFYVSPFLVQEWEIQDKSGEKKETLRLDLIGKSCDDYKGADILIFNTGHWWTHEKTSLGKGYYQEGSHVYGELNVLEAFRKALTTWARWIDANVNPEKTSVFFRGYSASHFSGGQWNSGGACDSETQPIKNQSYLTPYPPKMMVLEKVLKNMKTHVSYLNITRLTDFRKDGHPSVYRKKNLPEAERKAPLQFQDCSHWCLPGVPDAWNELLYAELLIRERQKLQDQRKRP